MASAIRETPRRMRDGRFSTSSFWSVILFSLLLVSRPNLGLAEPSRPPLTLKVCGKNIPLSATTLDLRESPCTSSDLGNLFKFKSARVLDLTRTQFTDRDLAVLTKMASLEELSLRDTQITNISLRHLSGLEKLRILDLRANEDLTGASLARLAGLRNLKRLLLSRGQLTDIGIANASKLPHLNSIETSSQLGCNGKKGCFDLRGGKVTERGIVHIAKLDVEHLLLESAAITDRTLILASRFKALQSINCHNVAIGGRFLTPGCINLSWAKALTKAGLRHLEKMHVKQLFLTPDSTDFPLLPTVTKLRGIDTLGCKRCVLMPDETSGNCNDEEDPCERWEVYPSCIHLEGSEVSKQDLPLLAKLSPTHLELTPAFIDGEVLRVVTGLKGLRSLNCVGTGAHCFNLEGAKVESADLLLFGAVKTLASLTLPEEVEVTPDVAQLLVSLPALDQVLGPQSCGITGKIPCKGPNTFDLRCVKVGDDAVARLAKSKNLRSLCLKGKTITDASAASLKRLRSLDALDVGDTSITTTGFRNLLFLPSLKALEVPPAAITDDVIPILRKHPVLRRLNVRRSECMEDCSMQMFHFCLMPGCGAPPEAKCVEKTRSFCIRGCADSPSTLWLGLDNTALGAQGVGELASIPKRLKVVYHRLSDQKLARLSSLANLGSLNCLDRGCVHVGDWSNDYGAKSKAITTSGVEAIARLPYIKTLILPESLITDRTMAKIAAIKGLQAINSEPGFSDQYGFNLEKAEGLTANAVESVAKIRHLKNLSLSPELITDEVLERLTKFPNLSALNCGVFNERGVPPSGCFDLQKTKVTEKGLRSLARLGNRLKRLSVDARIISDETLGFLGGLPGLDSLNCGFSALVPNHESPEVCVDLVKTRVTTKGLGALRGFKRTRRFSLPPELITDDTLPLLQSLSGIDSLNCLAAAFSPMDPYGMSSMFMPSCFNLWETSVTENGLRRLKSLKLKNIVAPEAIANERLQKLFPDTEITIQEPGYAPYDYFGEPEF